MFASFRRHQWLWIVIFGLTIISFVAFFSPKRSYGYRGAGSTDKVGSINGEPITHVEYADTYHEAVLRYYFAYQRWPQNDQMARQLGIVERETRSRLFMIHKMKELDVKVSEEATAQWIVEMFRDPKSNSFRKDVYDGFVKEELPRVGLTENDFERFARHEVGIQHLASVEGMAGKLVTPQEAETLYRRENEEVDTEVVFLSSSNYLSQVKMDQNALANYFTNHLADYRSPEKVQVTYVKFDATNYLAQADQQIAQHTNLNQTLEAIYQQRGTNTFLDTNNMVMSPDAAKQKLRNELQHQAALIEARKKATEFASELLEMPAGTNNLTKLAAAKGLIAHVTQPFTEFGKPPGLNVPDNFSRAAFRLTAEQPLYEEPLVGQDSVFVIALNNRIPSQVPALATVQSLVTTNFQRSTSIDLARTAGEELHKAVTAAMAQGKTFQAAVQEKKFKAIDLQPFSEKVPAVEGVRSTDLSALKTAAFALAAGQVSAFVPTGTGGFFVHLQAKVPVAADKVKAALPEYLSELRQSRQRDAFNDWLRKESEVAHIVLPGDQQRTTTAKQ